MIPGEAPADAVPTVMSAKFPGAATLMYCVRGMSVGYLCIAFVCLLALVLVNTARPRVKRQSDDITRMANEVHRVNRMYSEHDD